MNYVKIITTGEINVQIDDGNGNVYPQAFNEQLFQKIAGKTNIRLKRSTLLNGYAFDYDTIFKVAVDVIESLIDERVSGVVLIYERETMSELAFYLTLFTRTYKKPIVICSLPNELHVVKINEKNIHLKQQVKSSERSCYLQDLHDAIKIASDPSYGKLTPLTVHNGNMFLAMDDEQNNLRQVKRLHEDISTCKEINDEHLLPINQLTKRLTGQIPVIPEKVALIKLTLGMNGQEILNIVKHYAGAVIEMNHYKQVHPTVLQAMKRLVNYRIPLLVTFCQKHSLKDLRQTESQLNQNKFWVIRQLPSVHARLLLGVMIAQNLPWEKMDEICQIYR